MSQTQTKILSLLSNIKRRKIVEISLTMHKLINVYEQT